LRGKADKFVCGTSSGRVGRCWVEKGIIPYFISDFDFAPTSDFGIVSGDT
jgi:hypothetical protein